LQALTHQFEGFLEELSRPYHLLQVGTISGGRVRFGDSVILRSRRLQARSELETSLKCLWMPNLSSGRVQTIQRAHSARPYYWLYSGFQEGRTILGFLQFEEGASVFELHTSGGGFSCLDLSLGRIWQHQEVYNLRRAEPLVSLSSAGHTSNHQGYTSDLKGGRNPDLAVEHSSSIGSLWEA
jgi:hypothetical protein